MLHQESWTAPLCTQFKLLSAGCQIYIHRDRALLKQIPRHKQNQTLTNNWTEPLQSPPWQKWSWCLFISHWELFKQWSFHVFIHTDPSVKYLPMTKWTILLICNWSSSAFCVHWMCSVCNELEVKKLLKTLENKIRKDQGSPVCCRTRKKIY